MTIPLRNALTSTVITAPLNIPDAAGINVSLAFPFFNDEPMSEFQIVGVGADYAANVQLFNAAGPITYTAVPLVGVPPSLGFGGCYSNGVLGIGGSDYADNGLPDLNCYLAIAGGASGAFTVTNPHLPGDDQTTTAGIIPLNGGFGGFTFTGVFGVNSRQYLIDYTNQTISQTYIGLGDTFSSLMWNEGDGYALVNLQNGACYFTTFNATALGDPWDYATIALDYDDPAINAIIRNGLFNSWLDGDYFVCAIFYDADSNPIRNPIIVRTKKDLSFYDTITLSPGDPYVTTLFNEFGVEYDLCFAYSVADNAVYFAAGPDVDGFIFTGLMVPVSPPSAPPYIPPPALYRLPCYTVCQPLYIGRK